MSSSCESVSSGSESESDSESSEAKKKKLKQLKKLEKKAKKKEKKLKKKEKKLAKKEKKKEKKEGKQDRKEKKEKKEEKTSSKMKKDGKQAADEGGKVTGRSRSAEAPRTRSESVGPMPSKKHRSSPADTRQGSAVPYKAWEGSLLDVCEVAARGIKDKNATMQDDQVTVHGPDGSLIDRPQTFKTFIEIREFPREVQEAFKDTGFPGPSQIQAYCWPLALRGKDMIGIAATGSGKTLAFLMPAYVEMDERRHNVRDGPGLLVMSPTRELAQQTEAEANKFGRCLNMRCVAMYGGAPKGEQMGKYRQGCACIVACPGRLNDFLEGGQVQLRNTTRLVLDEADRMLDMGFEPQIRKIMERMPKERHTLFFTATWPREVRALASEILHKPYKVMIGNRDELKGNADVTQLVKIIPTHKKIGLLSEILMEAGLHNRGGLGKALIFCSSKRQCDQLSGSLDGAGVPCAAIHGDKDQRERDQALSDLKNGRIKVLVGTDVAARGLDIKGVGLVVNFDPPSNAEDYVHRIGRTGRAGAKGVAIALLTSDDGNKARNILEVMERTGQGGPPELHALAATAGSSKGGGRKGTGKGGSGAMMATGGTDKSFAARYG